MICIPKLALEIQDLSLPATVLLPRLEDIRSYIGIRMYAERSHIRSYIGLILVNPYLGCATISSSLGRAKNYHYQQYFLPSTIKIL